MAFCAGASQINPNGRHKFEICGAPSRKRSGMEIRMIDIVDILLEYYNKGMSNGLIIYLQGLSSKDIRVVVIEILGWLKLEHKRKLWMEEGKKTKLKPLILNYNYIWCKNLKEMVEKEPLFKQYFYIEGNEFNFLPSITEDVRKKAREKAFNYFNPQKRS